MNIREDFEAWATPTNEKLKRIGGTYHPIVQYGWDAWQAATSRQEAKITNLLNALIALSRQIERMRESGVVWDDVGPEQMAIEAIAAAKEQA